MTPDPFQYPPVLRIQSLAYNPDSASLFAHIAQDDWSIFLDSGGRDRDILVTQPIATLVTQGQHSRIECQGVVKHSTACPFKLLRELLGPATAVAHGHGFAGGALGYLGYDLGRRIEQLPSRHTPHAMPDLAVGIYNWALVTNHVERSTRLLAFTDRMDEHQWQALMSFWSQRIQGSASVVHNSTPRLHTRAPPTGNPWFDEYSRAFATIQAHIRKGDCYQVNFARRFHAQALGDPWLGYRHLRQLSPAPFGAYLKLPQGQLLCNSPEHFLRLDQGRVTTSPIKGTRPRHHDPVQDAALRQALEQSPKDRAENLMIVDLLRNDLGRVCDYGSVRVDALFRSASFATLHHLISDISGQLRPGEDAISLLKATFPGGSITGAPKLHAMAIIEELEVGRRGPYCGSLAWIGFDGAMDSNILIRTLVHRQGEIEFWAGGGIVADSSAEDEFAETQHKARAIMQMLE